MRAEEIGMTFKSGGKITAWQAGDRIPSLGLGLGCSSTPESISRKSYGGILMSNLPQAQFAWRECLV
jgi:hypothetical protein